MKAQSDSIVPGHLTNSRILCTSKSSLRVCLLLTFSGSAVANDAPRTASAFIAYPVPRKPCGHSSNRPVTLFASSNFDDSPAKIPSSLKNNRRGPPMKNKWLNRIKNPSTSPLPYVRIQKRGRHYDVQTAVTTFQKAPSSSQDGEKPISVDLHAQTHFGDDSYFQYFNDRSNFSSVYDKVLYELIVEEDMLSSEPGLRKLLPVEGHFNPIAPTASDRNIATQYGLKCQVDAINYCQDNWVHADLTREEFLSHMARGQTTADQPTPLSPNSAKQQPLWALASTTATYPGSEFLTALLRPLAPTNGNDDLSNSATLTRRLFTHLFLPGDALSGWIRAALWCGVPSPELSIMLVDWSSLSYSAGRRRRFGERVGANAGGNAGGNIAPISPIAAPVLLSLLTGNWGTARRLVFGQVLVGGQSNADTSKNGVLIQARNQRAVEVLRKSIEATEALEGVGDEEQRKRIALLYGAAHCRDLQRRLVEEEGMVPVRTEWRTAFRATAPRWGDYFEMDGLVARSKDVTTGPSSSSSELSKLGEDVMKSMSLSTLESVAVGLVVLPLYFLIGGLDWVSTLGDLGTALDGGLYPDGLAAVFLYLLRHVALYVAISKFVVDWGGSDGVFEDVDTV
mmetsp:Transcript_29424/g.61616  ORF Transcript_29424/g.61616 Transcript_29424/m.61616 type:complete len:623 (-) Transcript_29424:56-1924(-)